MANIYSQTVGGNVQGHSIDDSRRVFNFGERVSELNPAASPFFSYLSKVSKKPTDDPVFKFMEKRHQWQRRNFRVETAVGVNTWATEDADLNILDADNMYLTCDYDKYGRKEAASAKHKPEFITEGQILAIEGQFKNEGTGTAIPVVAYYKVGDVSDSAGLSGTNSTRLEIVATFIKALYVPDSTNSGVVSFDADDTLQFAADAKGQVVGTAWAEASRVPEGWRDEFYVNEGYAQIFKTAVPLFSGTALATRYRGDANEYMRVYQEKLMEHKMDIENALLFGYGAKDDSAGGTSASTRKTWGILPYTEIYGKMSHFTYSGSTYDTFVDEMSSIFDAESGAGGNKLVLASRSIMNWLNKLGGSSFLGNTMSLDSANGSNPYAVDISRQSGMFNGVNITKVDTLYGTLNFVMEPLLRGPWANHAIAIDLNNVAYRPLAGNGESRDTQIMTNVQDNAVDGRQDLILTEAGLEISLPETHAILKFTS
jgi:hypothetical protein